MKKIEKKNIATSHLNAAQKALPNSQLRSLAGGGRELSAMAPPPPQQPKNHSRGSAATGGNGRPPRRMASRDAGERAAFFARREAAAVLRRVLRGDATRRSAGSIKSLVYSPTVRNKRATFALVCQTLKCK